MEPRVSWRGRLSDPDRIDGFEDAVLDLALEFGGYFHPFDPPDGRRGGLLDLAPGLGRVALAVAADGRLVSFPDEPPDPDGWVSADVRFASAERHVLLVETLEALRDEFLPGLEIRDGAGYAGAHDLNRFLENRRKAGADASPVKVAILRRRVRSLIERPSERRLPIIGAEDEPWGDSRASGTETEWDELWRREQRKTAGLQRSLHRTMEEGADRLEAFDQAMRDEGIVGLPGEEPAMELPSQAEMEEEDQSFEADPEDRTADLPEVRFPPLLLKSRELSLLAYEALGGARSFFSAESLVLASVCDMAGGLAQAISFEDRENETPWGLVVVQLKRALRGIQFARGGIPACLEAVPARRGALGQVQRALEEIEREVNSRLDDAREAWAAGKP